MAVAYATGRAFLASLVKGDDPAERIHWYSSWGFGVGLTTPHSKKTLFVTIVEKRKIWLIKI